MYDTQERERGVVLTLLDFSAVEAEATEVYREKYPEEADVEMEVGNKPYAFAEKDGHLFVVCNEGVGWEVTEDDPLELDLYTHTEKSFGIFPVMAANLSPDEVHKYASDETVDLADHVRKFGSRLENNFWLWHGKLESPTT